MNKKQGNHSHIMVGIGIIPVPVDDMMAMAVVHSGDDLLKEPPCLCI